MIREEELLDAIAECQGTRNPNANTCIKLASFYTILDHIKKDVSEPRFDKDYSYDVQETMVEPRYASNSEFGKLISNKDNYYVLKTVDELMETLRVMQPRLYDAFMKKLTALD